jgi:hypothetical protein
MGLVRSFSIWALIAGPTAGMATKGSGADSAVGVEHGVSVTPELPTPETLLARLSPVASSIASTISSTILVLYIKT